MRGRSKYAFDIALFDDLALLHHAHPLRDLADNTEVVRDEEKRHSEPLLKLLQQFDDLRLNGDIERGGRFVGDQQVRFIGERHRDHDALPLAAGKLVRIARKPRLGIGYPDLGQHLKRARSRRGAGHPPVQQQNLGDLLFDGVQRIERRHRLLEHNGDVVAAHAPHIALGER